MSLSDLDPTYSKGKAGKLVSGAGAYIAPLFNPLATIKQIGADISKYLMPDIDYSDRKVNSRSPVGGRRIVYGEARVGGQFLYIESEGKDLKYLHIVLAVAGHELEEIGDVFINDVISTDPKFDGVLDVYKQPSTGVNSTLDAYLLSRGKTSYLYENIAYVYCKLKYDEDAYSGVPTITATIKGKNSIYDPRTLTSGYSRNAALCMLDFIKNEIGAKDEFIDYDSFVTAANICDETVAAAEGGTEPRFELNGTLARQGSKTEQLARMASNCGVFPSYQQGRWQAVAMSYVAPEVDAIISESDIIGDVDISTGNGKQDKVNTIVGTYIDAKTNYEQIEYPSIQTVNWEAEDKEILQQSIDYPLVNSGTQCRRLSKIALEQSRRGITFSFNGRYKLLKHQVGDRVKVNYAAFGWVEKVFRIAKREISPQDGVAFSLTEDDPAIYSWEEGDALATVVPPFLNMPNPNNVEPPVGFSITEALYQANTRAAVKARADFTWTDGDDSTRHYEIQGSYEGGDYRVISSYIIGNSYKFDDLQVGSWAFRIRGFNSIGSKSAWVDASFNVIGKTEPPSDVTGFSANVKPFSIELTWDSVPDLDADEYEIRYGTSWASSTLLQKTNALTWTWETRPAGTENLLIKAIDTSGNYSLNAVPADVLIQLPKAVSPLTAKLVDNNVELRWADATTSFNIDKYRISRGDTFNGSEVVGDTKGTFKSILEVVGGTYTYWVVAYDIKGNTSPPVSVLANVDQPPDFILQANQLIDLSSGTKANLVNEVGDTITFDSETDFTWDSETAFTFDLDSTYSLVGPANTAETWSEHFEALSGWVQPITLDSETAFTWDSETAFTFDEDYQSIQELQLDNGYPYYLQPTPSSASYEQVIDFTGVLAISRIQLTPFVNVIAGAPTVTYTVSYSADNVTYVDTIGTEATGVNFRYVKIKVDIASASGLDLLEITGLRLRLDVKLKTDAGRVTITDTAGPTAFNFNIAFVDIQSITVSANGTDLLATYNFVDVPNPTGGSLNLQDLLTGNRVTGEVSWNARGV